MKFHRIIKAELPVIIFKEGKKFVAYSPALDLSTCASTFEQARKRFAEAVDIFFQEILEMGTLEDVLKECGWQKISKPREQWIPPHIIAQVQQEIKIPVASQKR
jgi:predicted RNase H-like HicB family nuclease